MNKNAIKQNAYKCENIIKPCLNEQCEHHNINECDNCSYTNDVKDCLHYVDYDPEGHYAEDVKKITR